MNTIIMRAVVKSIVSGHNRKVTIKAEDVEIGDIVLLGRTNDSYFGSFDVGRVEEIYKIAQLDISEETNVVATDVITDSSDTFKKLKEDLRKREIKKEIEKRMKEVDEIQRMQMYAESDEEIAKLMEELKSLRQ